MLFLFVQLFGFVAVAQKPQYEVDICVYGGSSAGLIAAYAAKQSGKSVILIEPGNYLGGLTTGGLGATDIGNKYAVTGLAKEFYRRIGAHYGKFEQWTFEPHVAGQVYDGFIKKAKLDIVKNFRLIEVKKEGEWIRQIVVENSNSPSVLTNRTIKAKMFIDATYEGDLMARAGVSYTLGRESNAQYGETYNGVQLSEYHQLPDDIDPYVERGKPSSGLVWGVSGNSLAPNGAGDKLIQAYNFRLCLTQDKKNQIPISKPERYDVSMYELLARILEKEKWTSVSSSYKHTTRPDGTTYVHHFGNLLIKDMPNGKTDANNFGGFSTDMIGGNHNYPEADYETRKKIWREHEDYTKGLLYFLTSDSRVPAAIRANMSSWGYTKDEFKDLNGFSNQLYVREARRMVSDVVMNQAHCEGREVVTDAVGMAAYGMDSHNCQRIVVNGMVKNEGDVQKKVAGPFPISYRSIVPKANECKNLAVPICVSASHIAFGSIRMEPVFMVLGQSAAVAASMAIDQGISLQQLDVKSLQQKLVSDPLLDGTNYDILIDNDDPSRVKAVGNWTLRAGGYGVNRLGITASPDSKDYVRYEADPTANGTYEAWIYFSTLSALADQISAVVTVGDKKKDVLIETAKVKQLGLPSGEWVSLGKYKVAKGQKATVDIYGKGASKIVVADALIWKKQ